eukprot:TRINITY_DN10896_c0_g1_i1.p1 TRINITY_DN10896_c0_g1~~TRINITY_DN10896_c0_g1_i1.p1  ORF type:complete len:396 (+),score=84.43 TRINITY_DN10896_c0_g1_i1:120-1307(+)
MRQRGSQRKDEQGSFKDESVSSSKSTKKKTSLVQNRSTIIYGGFFIFYFLTIGFSLLTQSNSFNLPSPLPADAPLDVFSEGRAFRDLKALVEIGKENNNVLDENGNYGLNGRLFTQKSGEKTAQYILNRIKEIAKETCPSCPENDPRFDITVTNDSGHLSRSFRIMSKTSCIASFDNITNVIIRTFPENYNSKKFPRTVVNAHYDSVAFSPGASDNAVHVAATLEHFRLNLLTNEIPLIFLFNDGEEAGLLGAAAFAKMEDMKAEYILNFDSAGGWGRTALTQASSRNAWLGRFYGRVPFPSSSSIGQEFMESGFIPSTTDFEIFSRILSGYDIDFTENGYTYHTPADDILDYVPGTLQCLGENSENILKSFRQFPEPEDVGICLLYTSPSPRDA